MDNTARDREALTWHKLDESPFKIDGEPAGYYMEERVLVVVLVPVELAQEHAQPDDAVVHTAEALVPPGLGSSRHE